MAKNEIFRTEPYKTINLKVFFESLIYESNTFFYFLETVKLILSKIIFFVPNLEFPSFYCQIKTPVKLQILRNCHETIVSIGLRGKWRHNETTGTYTVYVMQYNLDILII